MFDDLQEIATRPRFTNDQVRKLRKRLKMRQAAFAAIVGTTVVVVSRWENDQSVPNGSASHLLWLVHDRAIA